MEMEDSPSDSELLEGLEDDDYREQRIREIQSDITRRQINAEFVSRGGYREYTSEKEVMDVGLKEAKAVVHFFHPRFKRCEIMDTHLEVSVELINHSNHSPTTPAHCSPTSRHQVPQSTRRECAFLGREVENKGAAMCDYV